MFIKETEEVYQRLWFSAQEAFSQGNIQTDPHLSDLENDLRRGITLIARPSPVCVERFAELCHRLGEILPQQYFYDPRDFHITILTLVDAYAGFSLDETLVGLYDKVLSDVLSKSPPFEVMFGGISATPSTIMTQGHLRFNTINEIRDTLREALKRVGLGDTLDPRYKNMTAHSVVMRFKRLPDNPCAVFQQLEAFREIELGVSIVGTVYFVLNDWYMSHDKTRILREYKLEGAGYIDQT